ncbi:unnamed protein product [Camellia sinensis]
MSILRKNIIGYVQLLIDLKCRELIGTVKIHRCKVNQIFASGQLDNETVHKRNYRTSSLASKPYNARPFFTYLELTRPHNPFQCTPNKNPMKFLLILEPTASGKKTIFR